MKVYKQTNKNNYSWWRDPVKATAKSLTSINFQRQVSVIKGYNENLPGKIVKLCEIFKFVNPINTLHPYKSMHILHTVLFTFPKVPIRRMC